MIDKRRIARTAADALAWLLRAGGKSFYRYMLDALWERQPFWEDAADDLSVELYYPGYRTPDPADDELVDRIFRAYRSAKRAQRDADPVFLPSSLWQARIDEAFAPLSEGRAADDPGPVRFFLANFRSWKLSTGIDPSQLIYEYSLDRRQREHFERRVVAPMVRWWMRAESQGRDLSALTMPRHGNQCGALVNGHLISPSSVFCDMYGRLLADFAPGPRPVVAELGGGFGKQFSFLARHLESCCYLGFDLPETLCCAAFFLMKSFPERRFLLHGEGGVGAASLAEYDVILRPSFEIADLPDGAVDLFVNENSLGVTTPDACRRFVAEICRVADAFWHRNAESSRVEFADGTRSLVNREFPVPADRFARVARSCDVSRLMHGGRLNFDTDMYWYLYRRRDGTGPEGQAGRTRG